MSQWIDFKKLRRELNFEQVLSEYGVTLNIRNTEQGRQHSGACPLQPCKGKASAKKTFSANLDAGIWQCFGCRQKGNALDFIGLMAGFDVSNGQELRKAAMIATERFLGGKQQKAKPDTEQELPLDRVEEEVEYTETRINAPLDFTLKSLDPNHPWFAEQGLSKKTVEHFGLGYCSKGWLKGRIAIPLHDIEGRLIGYAGRLLDEKEATDENPLYIFPETRVHKGVRYEFKLAEFVYNLNQIQCEKDCLITTDINLVWEFWQKGECAVSIVGRTFYIGQKELLLQKKRTTWR